MKGKIYISGKISGLPKSEVQDKFRRAAERLRADGYEPVNPLDNGLPDGAGWHQHMAADIVMLMSCGAIYLLHDWEASDGAQLEYHLAVALGKSVVFEATPVRARLVQAIEQVFGVEFKDIANQWRNKRNVMARMIFSAIASGYGLDNTEIAMILRRDRTTIIYYLHQHENDVLYSREYREYYMQVKDLIDTIR